MIEGEVSRVPAEEFEQDWVVDLHRNYPVELDLEFPSPLNGQSYGLCSRSYVGIMPSGEDLVLEVNPKIPCRLLMEMLECAYATPKISEELVPVGIGDIFEFWADYLARKTLRRIAQGVYWDYAEREERSGWIRGRLLPDGGRRAARPICRYAEHTADIIENQILAATLGGLKSYTFKRDVVRRSVYKAWKGLGAIEGRRLDAAALRGVRYHRLNLDYKPLHALCQIFLRQGSPDLSRPQEGSGPAYIVHMPTLFERFCTAYLQDRFNGTYRLDSQYYARLKGGSGQAFRMDMAMFDARGDKPLAVLDAKYKIGGAPIESDIQQVVAYAVQLGVQKAFLLYPVTDYDQSIEIGSIQVRALGFDLAAENLEEAGARVVSVLAEDI